MNTRVSRFTKGPGARQRLRLTIVSLTVLCALTAVATAPADARIMFARASAVPVPVREFAWRVIETRCNYQSHERGYRSFWAYEASARASDASIVYSISVLSDVPWRKAEPPALIQLTILHQGEIELIGLKSSFVTCSP
jgi:hypothetical protein